MNADNDCSFHSAVNYHLMTHLETKFNILVVSSFSKSFAKEN